MLLELVALKTRAFKKPLNLQLQFSGKTDVLGRNDAGKSTIADAIVFALVGTNQWGKKDCLIPVGDLSTQVALDIKIDGKDYSIVRSLLKSPNGAISSSLGINGLDSQVADINKLLGLSNRTIISMLNPKYFLQLSKAEKKEVLYECLKDPITYIDEVGEEQTLLPQQITKRVKDINEHVSALQEEVEALTQPIMRLAELRAEYADNPVDMGEILSMSFSSDEEGIAQMYNMLKAYRASREIAELTASSVEIHQEAAQKNSEIMKLVRCVSQIEESADSKIKELNSKFKAAGIDIALEEVSPRGKVKSVIDVLYNNVPIECCSNSEYIRMGIKLAKAFSSFTGVTLPTIVDNAESVSANVTFDSQAVCLYFADMPLCVAIDDDTAMEIASSRAIPRTPLHLARRVVIKNN